MSPTSFLTGIAEIRPGENNPGGDDADADLGDAGYRKHEGAAVQAAAGAGPDR